MNNCYCLVFFANEELLMNETILNKEETVSNFYYANIYFICGLMYYEKKEYITAIKYFLTAKRFDPSLKEEVEMIIIELIKLNDEYVKELNKLKQA